MSPACRIDIYADASRLTPGKSNPVASAGCGAVIVEGDNKRTLACEASDDAARNTPLAECEAIKLALSSVHENE